MRCLGCEETAQGRLEELTGRTGDGGQMEMVIQAASIEGARSRVCWKELVRQELGLCPCSF